MFHKNNRHNAVSTTSGRKDTIPSIVTKDINVLGNIISEGNIDFDGTLNGNIRCNSLTIRANGSVKGEIVANSLSVYGTVKGLMRAKSVQLFAGCNVEGIIMHETIAIEDGAVVDGKFKRTDRVQTDDNNEGDADYSFDDNSGSVMMENIRLIR